MSDDPPGEIFDPSSLVMPWNRPLSFEETAQASNFINSKVATGPDDPCPSCGDGVSEVLGSLATIPMAPTIQYPNGKTLLPAVVAVCMKCGYIRFFHAAVAGLFDLDRSKGT